MIRFSAFSFFTGPLVLGGSLLAACTPASNDSKVTAPNDAPPASNEAASASSAKADPTPPGPANAPPPGPEWTLHGKRFVVKSGLIKSYGGLRRDMYVSNEDLGCDSIKGHGSASYNDTMMTIEMTPSIKANAPARVTVTYPTSDKKGRTPMTLETHTLKMPAAAVKGVVSMPFDLNFTDTRMDSSNPQTVALKGTVDFKDCGDFPASPKGEVMPQPKLKLEVSGESVEIKGALLLNDAKEPRLILTSQPNSCERDSFSDVTIELRYKGSSDLSFAVLMGNRVDSAYQTSQSRDLKAIKSKIPAKLPNVGSKLDIPLEGELELPADYKLKLSGSVTALVCKP